MNILTQTLGAISNATILIISTYLPKLVAGFLILFIGLIVASLLRDLVKVVFKYFALEKWLATAGIASENQVKIWPAIVSELIRWVTIFIFLTSAVEVWGLPKVGEVLNQLLLFLPNVFLAVIIGWIGLMAAKFAYDIVRHSLERAGEREAMILASIGRFAIIFFTTLIILNQLGVAADLVKILFTGIVAMLSLAFGLAFGLGGKEAAGDIIKNLSKKFREKKSK